MRQITLSTLFFYKQDLSKKFVEFIIPTLVSFVENNDVQLEFVITDNTPREYSVLPELEKLLSSFRSSRFKVVLKNNSFNLGFGPSHNQVFRETSSDIFIVLNNDLFLKDQTGKWLSDLCAPLESEDAVAIVGAVNSPSVLNSQGEGRWKEDANQAHDYAEGSILAVRSSVARKLGLFSEDLDIAYFEDSDLSLRYRQAGHQIAFIDLPHEHHRGSSSKLVDPDVLTSIRIKNKVRFLKRWGLYLEKRTLTNRLFLDFCSGGWGDVIAAIPVMTGWLRDHPTAMIDLQTNQIGLKNILSLDRVNIRTENFITPWQARESGAYDRVFSLSDVDYSSPLHLGTQIAQEAGVNDDLNLAKEAVMKRLKPVDAEKFSDLLKNFKKICLVHVSSPRNDWEGRSLVSDPLVPALISLKENGFSLVLVGMENEDEIKRQVDLDLTGKTSLEDIFHLMGKCELFFGMDSGPMHVAQMLMIPSFVIFGATLPTARLTHFSNSYGYIRSDLACIGCYHQKVLSPRNYCIRRDEACVKKLEPKGLKNSLEQFIDSNFQLSHGSAFMAERVALQAKEALRMELGSSRFKYPDLADARLRQLLSALKGKLGKMLRDRLGIN